MWRNRRPSPADYPSDEEFQEALSAYEDAESTYVDECLERYYDSKYNN